jgi:Ankyrin repeats (3 copies)
MQKVKYGIAVLFFLSIMLVEGGETITEVNSKSQLKDEPVNFQSLYYRTPEKEVRFIFPAKDKAFFNKDYNAVTIYPFLKRWLGYKDSHKKHPLLDALCRKMAGILSEEEIEKYKNKAIKMVAANPSDVIATIFLFNSAPSLWKQKEWSRRIRLCRRKIDHASFYSYLLLWIQARVEKRHTPFAVLRNRALAFAAKNTLNKRDSQYIFRLVLECTSSSSDQIKSLNRVRAIKKSNRWLKNSLLGVIHIKLAWKARGSSWGYKVTDAGRKGFRSNLKTAEKYLTEAWNQHQDLPEPAAFMIIVTKGNGSIAERIMWFNRAIAAQVDYHRAYGIVASALLPRWCGSVELLIELGNACYDSGLYEGDIPIKMLTFFKHAASEMSEYQWQTVYRQPGVMEKIDKCLYYWCLVKSPENESTRTFYQSSLAIFNFYAGNYEKTQEIIEKIGIKKFTGFENKLYKHNSYYFPAWINVTDSIEYLNGPYGKLITQAEKDYLAGNRQHALETLKTLLVPNNLKRNESAFIAETWGRFLLALPAYNYSYGKNALFKVCEGPDFATAEKLLKWGIDINHRKTDGSTALYTFTACKRDFAVIKFLVKHGANINVQGYKKHTPLGWISARNFPDIVAFLLKAGADVNQRGNNNMTPLMIALNRNRFTNVKLLVEAGADVNAKIGRYRVWDYVKKANDPKITAYMKAHGAK